MASVTAIKPVKRVCLNIAHSPDLHYPPGHSFSSHEAGLASKAGMLLFEDAFENILDML